MNQMNSVNGMNTVNKMNESNTIYKPKPFKQMNTDLVIWRNENAIKSKIEQEQQYTLLFQPFVTALLKNEFQTRPTIEVIRGLIIQDGVKPSAMTIEPWLKEQALLVTPSINNMPTPHAAKLMLIDASKAFSNYSETVRLYSALPKQVFERNQISNYVIDDTGKVVLPPSKIAEIEQGNTVSAVSKEHKELYERATDVLAEMQSLCEKSGFNFFHDGVVPTGLRGEPDSWLIDPYAFNRFSNLNYYKTKTSKT